MQKFAYYMQSCLIYVLFTTNMYYMFGIMWPKQNVSHSYY